MTDREALERFFGGEFQKELAAVEIPGMPDASWDRKAAWLLLAERRHHPAHTEPAPQPDPTSVFD